MNNERSYENGRYVWAAILIILAVVLAAVAFVTWVIRADDAGNNARLGNTENGITNGTFELAEGPVGYGNRAYGTYDNNTNDMGGTVDNTYTAK